MTIHNAVIGFPLAHTASPKLHNAVYADLGLDAELHAMAGENVESLVDIIRNEPLELTAVTMPHKESIIPFLDEVDPLAYEIGAVNTVVNRGGYLHGYNTDIVGIRYALRDIKPTSVMLLGAGGAARPLALWAKELGAQLLVWNRSRERAEALTEAFGGRVVEEPEPADLLVNTTPLGMAPYEKKSPVRPEQVDWFHSIFDVIYHPYETVLLREAKASAKESISGLDMFIAQGLEQIRLWSGHELDPQNYLKLFQQ